MNKCIALCIGQDDYDPETGVTPLHGCVNDALLIGEMLRYAGFQVRHVHNKAATRDGITGRMASAVAQLRAGDTLVIWNSSHGYQVRDRSGDELHDVKDEAICTYDTDPRNPLIDDAIGALIRRKHPDATLFFASDSCHSGTLTRAQLAGDHNDRAPRLWMPPTDVYARLEQPEIELGDYLPGVQSIDRTPSRTRFFGLFGTSGAGREHRPSEGDEQEEMGHLFLSGCRPDQLSSEATMTLSGGATRRHGAMTFAFSNAVLTAWKAGNTISYRDAHRRAREWLAHERYDQTPQLEGPAKLKDGPVFGFTP